MRNRPPILLILLLALVLGFTSAAAGFAIANPGEGTVKIHEGAVETPVLTSDESKVCTFHVHGLSFDAQQSVDWWIDQMPPTGTANVIATQHVTADANGYWNSNEITTLTAGHYKLYWQIVPSGTVKHKVFKVECSTEPTTGTIAVTKYNDQNNDGQQQGSEPGLSGWVFNVTSGSTTVGSITTDASGDGVLDVAAGTYTVTEVTQANWQNTQPGGAASYTNVTVTAGGTTTRVFGNHYTPPADSGQLRVFKYNDLDGDGSRDLPNGSSGEPGLAGWSFTVQRMVEGSPTGSPQTLTTGSDPLGYSPYLTLTTGVYRVSENTPLPAGWSITDPREGYSKTVELGVEQSTTVSFGDHYTPPVVPESGTLQVTKYNDADRDGMRDNNEPGLAGWSFQVKLGAVVLATLVTDANGVAATSLVPGTYTVAEVTQTGWTNTDPGGTTPAKTVTVTNGQLTGVLFGNAIVIIPPTTQTQLVIQKYNDANANGSRESGEAGLSGFSFTVRSSDGAVVRTAVTGDAGTATLLSLPLATYTITEDAQAGWTNTDPGGTAGKTVTLTSATTSVTVAFGNAQVRLPSTATDDGTTGLVLTLVLVGGMALLFLMARRATRPA